MSLWNWIKHGITLLTFGSLLIGVVTLFSLDVEAESFGANILSSTFFLFLFALLAVYRVSMIRREKVDWISLSLVLLGTASLLIMLLSPKNIMAFWKPTLAIYIVLIGYTLFQKIHLKHWSGKVTLVLLITSCDLLLFPLLIKTGDALYYQISGYLVFATFLAAIANTLLYSEKS